MPSAPILTLQTRIRELAAAITLANTELTELNDQVAAKTADIAAMNALLVEYNAAVTDLEN